MGIELFHHSIELSCGRFRNLLDELRQALKGTEYTVRATGDYDSPIFQIERATNGRALMSVQIKQGTVEVWKMTAPADLLDRVTRVTDDFASKQGKCVFVS